MRRATVLVVVALFVGCAEPTTPPTAPTPTPNVPTPAPPAIEPALAQVWLCCGSDAVRVGTTRQLEARATWADGKITDITPLVTTWRSSDEQVAQISSSGMVTGLTAGDTVLSISYRGLEDTWGFRVTQSTFRPAAPDEISGYVDEITHFGPAHVHGAEAEYDGRKAVASSGFYRISGLQTAGLDLFVRKAGYRTTRVTVGELGRELSPVVLVPDPSMVSDFMEGEVCFPNRTISKSFTPNSRGVFRITSAWGASTIRALYANGVLFKSYIGNYSDEELSAGVHYEFRVTGSCDYSGGTLRLTFLRPQ